MAFTSASFIVLTIASVLLYYIVPKKAQWCILLLASAAFYMARLGQGVCMGSSGGRNDLGNRTYSRTL